MFCVSEIIKLMCVEGEKSIMPLHCERCCDGEIK